MEQNHEYNISNQAKRAFSTNENIPLALKEIKEQLGDAINELIIYFASSNYNPDKISKEFQQTFPKSQTVGCTTAGELFGGEILQNSIVAIALGKNIIRNFHIEIINNIDDLIQINNAFKSFFDKFGIEISQINSEKYVGLLLTDGLNGSPEKIISRIDEITEIPFLGGSAGDDWKLEHTYIYANGKYYEKAAIIIFLEPKKGFKILKTQSFEPIGEIFTATSVDESKRCLKTIDNIPAAIFYARQIGIPLEKLQQELMDYSIGHLIYDEAYLHDSITFDKDYNLYLHSSIPKGAEIQVLKITDIIKDTQILIETEIKNLPSISAIINFNCGSRDLKIRKENKEKEFKKIFEGLPMIGFSTYGEFYISFINQTSTILILF